MEICGTETEGNGTGLSHVKVKGQTINVGGDSRTSISAHEGGESSLTAEDDDEILAEKEEQVKVTE